MTAPSLREAATMALEGLESIVVGRRTQAWTPREVSFDENKAGRAIVALRSALALPDAEPVTPDGWRLVPVILTEEMTAAGRDAQLSQPCHMSALMVYRAMLAAAPQPAHVPEVGFGNIAAPLERKPLPDAEPVRWEISYIDANGLRRERVFWHNAIGDYRDIDPGATSTPLYAAPQPAPVERKPLSDDEIRNATAVADQLYTADAGKPRYPWSHYHARAIEAAHNIKGKAC